jgi:hypothetical protein
VEEFANNAFLELSEIPDGSYKKTSYLVFTWLCVFFLFWLKLISNNFIDVKFQEVSVGIKRSL